MFSDIIKKSSKINVLTLFLLFNSSCAYFTHGLTDVPSGCQVESYRKSDGSMHYYLVGDKCNNETIERIRVRNEKAGRGF